MQNTITVVLDGRFDDGPIVCCGDYPESSSAELHIRPGAYVTAKHFGVPIYLEVIGIHAGGEVDAVIAELDDDIFDQDIITLFEMNIPIRISEQYIFSVDQCVRCRRLLFD